MLITIEPRDFVLKAEVVGVLTFIHDKTLLLQRLPNHPQANLWCPPGGKLHVDETPQQAAIRELFEETALQIQPEQLIDLGKYYVRYPNGDFIYHLFKTYVFDSHVEIKINDAEHQAFYFCPVENIYDLPLSPGLDECFKHAL